VDVKKNLALQMLGRIGAVGTLALTQRRHRTTLLATAAAASLVSATVLRCSCEIKPLSLVAEPRSLVVPTLEATLRAMRLVSTSVLMVMDYELAKVAPYFTTQANHEKYEDRKRLESEIELRESHLEEAQLLYASAISGHEDKISAESRKELKFRQRQAMHEAAQRLAEAMEQLLNLGGESPKSRLHRRGAERLLRLCRQNGGVYIKVGQHLANLDYLIPQEYIDVLSSLFDEAPQSKYEDVCRVIEEEFGSNVDQLYDNFEATPIASASLAQVHVAYEKGTGRKLAVKVQHSGLRETSAGDIFAVTTMVRLIESIVSDFAFGWIATEIAPNLPKELDFIREGNNAEKAAAHIKETGLDCVVPKIIWKSTSSRVLTMEFEEGFKATDLKSIEEAGLNKQ
jgi:hypothetical protein